MQISIQRGQTALLVAILFALLGSVIPVMYATYSPQSNYIESHSVKAPNTSTTVEKHHVCFDRTIKQSSAGNIFTQLYLVNGEDRLQVSSDTQKKYFSEGREVVLFDVTLPESIETGKYRYLLIVKMDLAHGRVERSFSFESNKFTISNDSVKNTSSC